MALVYFSDHFNFLVLNFYLNTIIVMMRGLIFVRINYQWLDHLRIVVILFFYLRQTLGGCLVYSVSHDLISDSLLCVTESLSFFVIQGFLQFSKGLLFLLFTLSVDKTICELPILIIVLYIY